MNIITTKKQLEDLVEHYSKVDGFAFDVETVGDNRIQPVVNDVLWISLATDDRTDVIPMGHPNGEFLRWDKELLLSGQKKLAAGKNLEDLKETDFTKNQAKWTPVFDTPPDQLLPGDVFKALKPLFFSNKLKVGHNIKFDLKSVAKYFRGVVPTKPFFDTMMAAFVLDNRSRGKLGLKDCAEKFLKIKVEKGIGAMVEVHSFSDVAHYSGLDAEATWKLYRFLQPKLTGGLSRVWALEMDVIASLCDMELAGASIDVKELQALKDRLETDIDLARGKAYKLAGKPFAMNSVPEKQKLLFSPKPEGRGIKPNVKIKIALTSKGQDVAYAGGELGIQHFSVSSDALEFYRAKDELVDAILEYQDLNKLMTTYVIPYLGGEVTRTNLGKSKIVQKDSLLINGKVHTNFKSHGAETGRFSSSDPNLQNIPSSGQYGKLIRNLFIAPPGYKLVVADYSQIEPRIIAAFSGDPIMVNNYLTGGDIYTTIGDTMGVDRKAGKVLVLSIAYGVGPDKIAQQVGCSVNDAKDLLNRFTAQFSDIAKYKAKVIRMASQQSPVPYVETLLGRRRYIPDLKSVDKGLKSRADRQAFNTVIQGSAADIMKLAIIRAHSCFIDEPDVNVVLTVHDELVTVAREDLAEETAEAIRESMEGIKMPEITVPLIADVKTVDKWGEAK
jgi:DNA polymerase I-like protein with 3'-5' exonuclease and polymerase domains